MSELEDKWGVSAAAPVAVAAAGGGVIELNPISKDVGNVVVTGLEDEREGLGTVRVDKSKRLDVNQYWRVLVAAE